MQKNELNMELKKFFLDWSEVLFQACDAIVYKSACCSAEAVHCHCAETGHQPWQARMLLKVSCHPNGCESTCCSSSRCSAGECQHGWGVWWGSPEQLWHLLQLFSLPLLWPAVVPAVVHSCAGDLLLLLWLLMLYQITWTMWKFRVCSYLL